MLRQVGFLVFIYAQNVGVAKDNVINRVEAEIS